MTTHLQPSGDPVAAGSCGHPSVPHIPTSSDQNRDTSPATRVEKRSYRIKELIPITGLSRASVFRLIKSGGLRTVKSVGSTLILREDLDAYYASLKAA